jgi:glycosyltransferase involved in cell wall biosynthesis
MTRMKKARIALVHDWLTGMRGGEHVLEAMAELVPGAELFTLIHVPGSVSPALTAIPRHTSRMQKIPGAQRRYRHFLPLMPNFVADLDVSGFDLVLSSSHCVAKGVLKGKDAVHVSYVHAPMRYVWDRFDEYFGPGRASLPVRLAARAVRKRLQDWDRSVTSEARVDRLIANSAFIAERIRDCYGREASVVHPFADLSRFTRERQPGRNYLMVGAFAPYKRVDLAVEAFNRMGLPLLIVGSGQDEERLRKLAGPSVEFLGALSNEAITDLYSKARAFIFPGVEDFGITPLEAMASGTPVIALGEGGAAETVTPMTGVLFKPQTVQGLIEAVQKLEAGQIVVKPEDCRARAREFTRERFKDRLAAEIRGAWEARGKDPAALPRELFRG